MLNTISACTFLSLWISLTSLGTVSAQDLAGYWTGHLIHQDVPWEVGLDIQPTDTGHLVLLDIPSLVMAWEPVPCRTKGRTVSVDLPFGIGSIALLNSGDSIHASNADFRIELARRPAPTYARKEVEWTSSEVTLRGTLYFPENPKGPVPLVILTHGASTGHRGKWQYRSYAKLYLDRGVAVLLYDRRGAGASTGDANSSNLSDLTDDLLAGLERMRKEPGIDPQRIGVGGGSQAGYIGFMAAARSPVIRYLIFSSASAVGVDEQEIQNVVYYMRHRKEPAENIDTAKAYMRLYFYHAATGDRWPVLDSLARVAENTRWGSYLDQPLIPAHMNWWRANHNVYRPEQVLPLIHVPTLLVYGEKDYIVPPQEHTGLMQYYFQQAKNPALTLVVCPGADHGLELPTFTDADGTFHWPRKAPELFDRIDAFLKTYVF